MEYEESFFGGVKIKDGIFMGDENAEQVSHSQLFRTSNFYQITKLIT